MTASSLIKHMQQSLSIAQKCRSVNARVDDFQQLLDVAKEAIFVCRDDGVLVQFNFAAEQILAASTVIKINSRKQLSFIEHTAQRTFDSLKLQMELVSCGVDFGFNLCGKNISYRVKLQPWMHAQVNSLGIHKVNALMMSLRPFCTEQRLSAANLISHYGFTKAEAEAAERLCKGDSAQVIAGQRNSSINTVRQQIKTCMHKACCRSQADLVANILTVFPV